MSDDDTEPMVAHLSSCLQRIAEADEGDEQELNWEDVEAAAACHKAMSSGAGCGLWQSLASAGVSYTTVARAIGRQIRDAPQEAAWPAAALYSVLLRTPGAPVSGNAYLVHAVCVHGACMRVHGRGCRFERIQLQQLTHKANSDETLSFMCRMCCRFRACLIRLHSLHLCTWCGRRYQLHWLCPSGQQEIRTCQRCVARLVFTHHITLQLSSVKPADDRDTISKLPLKPDTTYHTHIHMHAQSLPSMQVTQ